MSKEKNAELIRQATQLLVLSDITLFSCSFSRGAEAADSETVLLQQKRATRFVKDRRSAESTFDDLLQVRVSLGTRLAFERDGDTKVLIEIEADFIVDYVCKSEVGQDAAVAFSEINAVHIVWPFWRQHVFDVVARAKLPPIEVPLLAGTRL